MTAPQGWKLLLVCLAGWVNRHQLDVIAYIQEENRVLRSKLKGKRIRFTDNERRRLAVKGKALGSRVLREVASVKRRLLVPLSDDYSSLCLFLILSPNKYRRMQFIFLFCFFFLSVNCCEFL